MEQEQEAKEITVPATTVDVTPEWISSILGYAIDPATFSIAPNAHEGKGFLSNLLRISCKKEGSSDIVNLIVKLIPELEEMREVVVKQNYDKTEILSYQKLLPALVTQVPQLADFICPFLYGKYEGSEDTHRSVLVLQDLKPFGYYTLDFGESATEGQIHEGIEFLAKFHFAGALAENLERKRLDQVYDFLIYDFESQAYAFQTWMRKYFPAVLKFLQDSNSNEDMQRAYAAMTPFTDDIVIKVLRKCTECPSIIHGDLWTNNILYNNDSSRHTKIIDWQFLCYKDVTIDLAIFIISSLPMHKITIENVQILVKEYYDLYQKLCLEKNQPNLQRRVWSEFETFFNTYGLSFTLIWFVFSMIAVIDKDNQRLLQIFEFFYKKGVVDFVNNWTKNCI